MVRAISTTRKAPYPPSPVIREVRWAPKESIIRQARGSDTWPLTWADDDALYTAYGDGQGFEPLVPDKLSLGFARVVGPPEDFTGINIRSATGERKGDGARGQKASGMLMVGGVLYLWVRNAGNSQLAWSSDHAKTWTWCDWRFETSFGCPTFLNFGKDYAGARDGYVYIYSPDGDSAYRGRRPHGPGEGAQGPDHRTRSLRVLQGSRRGRNSALEPETSPNAGRSSVIRGDVAARRSATMRG